MRRENIFQVCKFWKTLLSCTIEEKSSFTSGLKDYQIYNIAFEICFMNIFVLLESGLLQKINVHDIKCSELIRRKNAASA